MILLRYMAPLPDMHYTVFVRRVLKQYPDVFGGRRKIDVLNIFYWRYDKKHRVK